MVGDVLAWRGILIEFAVKSWMIRFGRGETEAIHLLHGRQRSRVITKSERKTDEFRRLERATNGIK